MKNLILNEKMIVIREMIKANGEWHYFRGRAVNISNINYVDTTDVKDILLITMQNGDEIYFKEVGDDKTKKQSKETTEKTNKKRNGSK